MTHANAKSKIEKFSHPHRDGSVGYALDVSNKIIVSFGATDTFFGSDILNSRQKQLVHLLTYFLFLNSSFN